MLFLDPVQAGGSVIEKYFLHMYHLRNGQEMDMKRVRSKNFERLVERAHGIVGAVNCNKYCVHSFTWGCEYISNRCAASSLSDLGVRKRNCGRARTDFNDFMHVKEVAHIENM